MRFWGVVLGILLLGVTNSALARDGIDYSRISSVCASFSKLETSTKRSVKKMNRLSERKYLRAQIDLYNSLSRSLAGKAGCRGVSKFFASEAKIAKNDLRKFTAGSFDISDSANARIARIERNSELAEAFLRGIAQAPQPSSKKGYVSPHDPFRGYPVVNASKCIKITKRRPDNKKLGDVPHSFLVNTCNYKVMLFTCLHHRTNCNQHKSLVAKYRHDFKFGAPSGKRVADITLRPGSFLGVAVSNMPKGIKYHALKCQKQPNILCFP